MLNLCYTSVMLCIRLDCPVIYQEQESGTCIGKLNRGKFWFSCLLQLSCFSDCWHLFRKLLGGQISQTVLIFAKSATWRFCYKLIKFFQEEIIRAAIHSNALYSYSMSHTDSFGSIFRLVGETPETKPPEQPLSVQKKILNEKSYRCHT